MVDRPQGDTNEIEGYRQGLRMAHPPDPVALEKEKAHLLELESKGLFERVRAYLKLIGPGYLQSAMTLGGGTASAALFAGAAFGYKLLWVAPVAMLLGVIVLSAVSYQTLSTGMRPFEAMRRFAGAPFAWSWALGAAISSIIWQFPQYALASGVLVAGGEVLGIADLNPMMMSIVVMVWAIAISMMYGSSNRMVRMYERLLKYMVWGVVVCFGIVVLKTGISDWGALGRGFFSFEVPGERNGVAGTTLILSGLAAAVGVNMLFLYPYTLLARGWGREHRGLARFDLLMGMFVPYALATSLMVIATANTLNAAGDFQGVGLSPIEAAQSLALLGGDPEFGMIVFFLGVLGMAMSSITLQMLTCGFVGIELFGWKVGSLPYRLATLLPVPGMLAPLFWQKMAVWVAVPTNILCGFFLPLAYVGFILLQRNRNYLGEDKPRGAVGAGWFFGLVVVTLILVSFLSWYAITKGPDYFRKIF